MSSCSILKDLIERVFFKKSLVSFLHRWPRENDLDCGFFSWLHLKKSERVSSPTTWMENRSILSPAGERFAVWLAGLVRDPAQFQFFAAKNRIHFDFSSTTPQLWSWCRCRCRWRRRCRWRWRWRWRWIETWNLGERGDFFPVPVPVSLPLRLACCREKSAWKSSWVVEGGAPSALVVALELNVIAADPQGKGSNVSPACAVGVKSSHQHRD